MIQVKCIYKFKDRKGKIYGYRLIDLNQDTRDVTSEDLKAAIQNNQINVINLTLTSDGRLIDKQPDKQLKREGLMTNKLVKKHETNTDFADAIVHKLNELIISLKSGDLQVDNEDATNGYLTGTIYDVHTKFNDKTYDILFQLVNEPYPEFEMQIIDSNSEELIVGRLCNLGTPLESKNNLKEIKKAIDELAKILEYGKLTNRNR